MTNVTNPTKYINNNNARRIASRIDELGASSIERLCSDLGLDFVVVGWLLNNSLFDEFTATSAQLWIRRDA